MNAIDDKENRDEDTYTYIISRWWMINKILIAFLNRGYQYEFVSSKSIWLRRIRTIFFLNNLCLVLCLRGSNRAAYYLIHIEWWSRTYCELVETEMERVCPLSISSVYVCLVQNNLIAPALFPLIIITCVYIYIWSGRLAATINAALMSKLFTFRFLTSLILCSQLRKFDLTTKWWRKIFPVYGVIFN
jgi:hypothetical protein